MSNENDRNASKFLVGVGMPDDTALFVVGPRRPRPQWQWLADLDLPETGAHLHGTFVSAKDGQVQVRKADGKIVLLVTEQLSAEDQRWIREKTEAIRKINQNAMGVTLTSLVSTAVEKKPAIAESFQPFVERNGIKIRQDERFFYVESNAMPDHKMMVGITAWQQQVPLPQPYFGSNAWRIPLEPKVAKTPLSAKSHFFRGAIALAANGVPIFNPIKNDGKTDTLLAGELDEYGGHCGRADDYHYHIAPVHLQEILGKDKPVAYALDGYPIYGFTEPDGSKAENLDAFNGHSTPELGYHYHATKGYPYLNGGFHGEVIERDGQVDPQPQAGGVRPALQPLRGAKITGFESKENKSFSVKVQVGNETRYVHYVLNENGSVKFDFVDANGKVKTETYQPRQRGPGAGGQRPGGQERGGRSGPGGNGEEPREGRQGRGGADQGRNAGGGKRPEEDRPPKEETPKSNVPPLIIKAFQSGTFQLSSPAVANGDPLPDEFNGNGEGATLPLQWKDAPKGTKSFAIVMDHIDRDNVLKTYWTLYGIPANVTSLPKNAKGIGKVGATWKRNQAYVPPHSAGGGKQTYTIHIYALSEDPTFDGRGEGVTREELLTRVRDVILDSAELNVTYQRTGATTNPPRPSQGNRNPSKD